GGFGGRGGVGGGAAEKREGVLLVKGQILVLEYAVRVTRSPHVHSDRCIPAPCEVGVDGGVSERRGVVLAVRNVLKDRRHWLAFGIIRQPHSGRETAAIRHRDPGVLYATDRPGELRDYPHDLAQDLRLARPRSRRLRSLTSPSCSIDRGTRRALARAAPMAE